MRAVFDAQTPGSRCVALEYSPWRKVKLTNRPRWPTIALSLSGHGPKEEGATQAAPYGLKQFRGQHKAYERKGRSRAPSVLLLGASLAVGEIDGGEHRSELLGGQGGEHGIPFLSQALAGSANDLGTGGGVLEEARRFFRGD